MQQQAYLLWSVPGFTCHVVHDGSWSNQIRLDSKRPSPSEALFPQVNLQAWLPKRRDCNLSAAEQVSPNRSKGVVLQTGKWNGSKIRFGGIRRTFRPKERRSVRAEGPNRWVLELLFREAQVGFCGRVRVPPSREQTLPVVASPPRKYREKNKKERTNTQH